jgi:ribosome biogenesis protein NSA1
MMCHPSLPLICTCGLDRYLRIYNYQTRALYKEVYLKQKMTAILFGREQEGYLPATLMPKMSIIPENKKINEMNDKEDDIWDNMGIVQEGPIKKKNRI